MANFYQISEAIFGPVNMNSAMRPEPFIFKDYIMKAGNIASAMFICE